MFSNVKRHVTEESVAFLACVVIYSMVIIWMLAHDFVSDFAQHRLAKVLATVAAGEFRLENISLLYPHAPIYLLSIFYLLPGMDSPYLPYFLSIIATAGLITLWNHQLKKKRYSGSARLLLLGLVASHPFILWAATSGLHNSLTLLVFYLFIYSCVLMLHLRDVRSIMMVSIMMALLFFTDERTGFIFLAFLPLIPLLAPRGMAHDSLPSVYIIIAFPLAVSVGSWVYLNWIFHGNPWLFIEAREASFSGAWHDIPSLPWLQHMGGEWLSPLISSLAMSALSFPAFLWLSYRYHRSLRVSVAMLALFLHPMIAISLSTEAFFLQHPINILYLLTAVMMAAILLVPKLTGWPFILLALLLAIGNVGGWSLIASTKTQDFMAWQQALSGEAPPLLHESDKSLGLWLHENPLETMVDDRVAYRAIVAKGDARGLILPYSDRFKLALKHQQLNIPQLAVIHPGLPQANMDALGQRFPDLYWNGMSGYRLVYDHDGWRVYRLNNAVAHR